MEKLNLAFLFDESEDRNDDFSENIVEIDKIFS